MAKAKVKVKEKEKEKERMTTGILGQVVREVKALGPGTSGSNNSKAVGTIGPRKGKARGRAKVDHRQINNKDKVNKQETCGVNPWECDKIRRISPWTMSDRDSDSVCALHES